MLSNIISWLMSLDSKEIFYAIVGGTILALIVNWMNLYRLVHQKYRLRKGLAKYHQYIERICSSLVVIGRRQGFSIKSVFEPLDLAPSDLMQKQANSQPLSSFVLVGGPGAGKSTVVKKRALDRLSQREMTFFVSLREYTGFDSIEEYLIHLLETHRVPSPGQIVRSGLIGTRAYCILDGLDEVRPKNRDEVCRHINEFYARYFARNSYAQLIVTCRKEAYRDLPLDISDIWEVRPLTDEQIRRLASSWPLGYPTNKTSETFWRDLASTPKVLELARSPLLLVGGLMQYTESNLGIPEERFEYLARIARWLTIDWSNAQGLPPDPFRPVYERVLPIIAFHLHSSQRSDCTTDETIVLLKRSLPRYGFRAEDAEHVLEGIITKTGILVRDTPGTVVFAQFSLQEYFASQALLNALPYSEATNLTPIKWWREVILLSAAQELDPSRILEALLSSNPILGAAAVAECPTPSLELQEVAIDACLTGLDSLDLNSRPAAISLLRKVRNEQESRFCQELEARLSGTDGVASFVGLVLATAGTAAATGVLAKHPGVWDKCLEEAGYLSTSFENLLVDWIMKGDMEQSKKAIELLSGRLSEDRREELINILPVLEINTASDLSSMLIKNLEEGNKNKFFTDPEDLWKLSRCAPYIQTPETYLSSRNTEGRLHDLSPVPASLHLSHSKKMSPNRLFNLLVRSLQWYSDRNPIFFLISSALSALAIDQFHEHRLGFLAISTIFFLTGSLMPRRLPWSNSSVLSTIQSYPIGIMIAPFLAGAAWVLSTGATFNITAPSQANPAAALLSLAFLLFVISRSRRWIPWERNQSTFLELWSDFLLAISRSKGMAPWARKQSTFLEPWSKRSLPAPWRLWKTYLPLTNFLWGGLLSTVLAFHFLLELDIWPVIIKIAAIFLLVTLAFQLLSFWTGARAMSNASKDLDM